jgi:quercetin dioxygenase-like cupin family protein
MGDYTVVTLSDAPDVLGDYPGEMRMLTDTLGAEQVALTWRRMPPDTGGRGSYGHSHKTQEELILVLEGTLTVKLGDEVLEAGPGTAIRIAPQVVRSVHNDTEGDVVLVLASVKVDDVRADAEMHDGFWD